MTDYRVDAGTGCWIWTRSDKRYEGYARAWDPERKRTVNAHRLWYERHVGPIPEGFHVDHLCRNRECVNPDHLEAVTVQENLRRGYGVPAINARKTHCKRGHPLEGDNLVIRADGYRGCRTCRRGDARRRNGNSLPPEIPVPPRTHCKRGHEFTPENTYVDTKGKRVCKTCRAAKERAYRARQKASRKGLDVGAEAWSRAL